MNVGGPPPGGRPVAGQPAAGAAPAAGQPQANKPPQTQQPPLPPNGMSMKAPEGFRPPQGGTLFAQVAGKDGQGYLLRMGEHLVRAKSGSPLEMGQSVQLRVQGEVNGQLQMQMMPGGPTGKHTLNDLANALADLKMPVNEGNLETAKALVENKLPLTKENMDTMQKLTQMPEGSKSAPPMSARVTAAVFLQQNNLPVTPQNMASIANFLAQNPQLGQQLMSMNEELRKMMGRASDSKGFDEVRELMVGLLEGESGGKLSKSKDKPPPAPPKKFFNAARQAGIEFGPGPFPGTGEDEWEILGAYREMRRKAGQFLGEEQAQHFGALLEEAEQNITAQRLLNQSVLGEIGCLYFQVPLRLEQREDMEIWLYFRRRGGGQDLGEEFRAEFLVNTEHLGTLFFIVEVAGIDVAVTCEVEEAHAQAYVAGFGPVLEDRIAQCGWRCTGVQVTPRRTVPGNPWLNQQESFQDMASYDVQA